MQNKALRSVRKSRRGRGGDALPSSKTKYAPNMAPNPTRSRTAETIMLQPRLKLE